MKKNLIFRFRFTDLTQNDYCQNFRNGRFDAKGRTCTGKKLLIVKPINLDGSDQSGYVVAVDTVGAGFHEKVLVVAGSSARLAEGNKDCPVDSAIVGVIDTIDFQVRKFQER
jgi:ethanolamine utilization protein EutN